MRKGVTLVLIISMFATLFGSVSIAVAADTLDVQLVQSGKAAAIYVDPKGTDYDGLSLVAKSFAGDVNLVTGITPQVITDKSQLNGMAVIAGSIGNNDIIDSLISAGKLDVSAVKGKWETYRIQVVDNPVAGVSKAVIVAGSDKRGTIYGIYHISELIGVSPWVYWGDVVPAKKSDLIFSPDQLNFTSKEPSVKYRGVFLNDEAPSLTSWCANKFGGINENFYDKLFEVLLRLKGNYLWPAMWSNCFSTDGKSDKLANAKHADAYGIIMGASHHEPMCRAGVEWQRIYSQYGSSNKWDWISNKAAITKFWDDGIKRNGAFENVITLGMRGENDTALMPGADLKTNIETLKEVINVQKQILNKYGLGNVPKILVCYTEVLDYWYGNSSVPGLKDWDGLKDVIIVLPDDNEGNTRTLPKQDERNRAGGWGLYYHIDMHGGCRSYEWVDTVPLEKMHEQMSMAYDYGCKNLWMVNVGDFKPMELSISYYLDMAYDFDTYGTNEANKTVEYARNWVKQQFGSFASQDTINGIAGVLSGYLRLNQANRPEITGASTFSLTNYNEALRELEKANKLIADSQKYYDMMPASYKDAYYQLVHYPAAASANVRKMWIYKALNQKYAGFNPKSVLANSYATLMNQSVQTDKDMQSYYNNTMAGGKWKGMMSSPHVGYKTWDSSGWAYPTATTITPTSGSSKMIVDVEGGTSGYTSGSVNLQSFTNVGNETYGITISNGGDRSFNYNVSANTDWIKLDSTKGSVQTGKTIYVSLDWSKVSAASSGVITITGAGQTVQVNVKAEVFNTTGLADKTFIETHNIISIEAEHTSNRVAKSGLDWKTIENYGRTLSSVKVYPDTVSNTDYSNAPYLEYKIYTNNSGNYTLTTYSAPTNNLAIGSRLKFAVSFDGANPVADDALEPNFKACDNSNYNWTSDIMRCAHITTTSSFNLTKGTHTMRIYGLDAGLVLQKFVLSFGALPGSYYGPEESFYIGKSDTPTHDPISAFSKVQAENFDNQSGIQTETCSDTDGGLDVGYIENGDYTVYNDVDFGTGAGSFRARVASSTSGGSIEIRLDKVDGTLVGTCPVTVTGGWQAWVDTKCSVSGVSGKHDLYLVFTGVSGYLLNFNWFTFETMPVAIVGDLNADTYVDAVDFALLKMYLLGSVKDFPAENDLEAADLNADKVIDALDFAVFKQYLLGTVKELPYKP
ncbi:MAG TPA: glycosyl hydrolase 115 family protein [Clostridia bacterium]|nr:glycosyl hydrolase 115 family protein [Clostridia bacterium]